MGELDRLEQENLTKQFSEAHQLIGNQGFIPADKKKELHDMLVQVQQNLSEGADSQEINNTLTLLPIIIETAQAGIQAEEYGKEQEHLATTDALTGAYSKRFFDDTGATSIARLGRGDIGSAAIVYIDIDKFKDFNTNYGHNGGDEALKYVTDTIQSSVRNTDIVARLGGDEFAVICVHKDKSHDFSKVRDKIYNNFDGASFEMNGQDIPVSVSAGIAELTPNDSLEAAKDRADIDMYNQKEARHRVLMDRQADLDAPGQG
ncbi:MAG: GGDEF domain-containing protein [Alphaproteobacteria bacterium]